MVSVPHNTGLSYKAVPPQRDHNSMSRPSTPQVSSDDGTARDDGLATEDDVLRACDGRATGDFVPCVLSISSISDAFRWTYDALTVSMYSALE